MEKKQIIIAVGREFGSGGRVIAEKLAKRYEIPLYDHNIIDEIANKKNVDAKKLKKYDESSKNIFLSRTVKGYSNAPEDNIANMQFEYLKGMAKAGDSFVIIGRCAEMILKDQEALISIFVSADMDVKIERIKNFEGISEQEAKTLIQTRNKKRKMYHNSHCKGKWGDSRNYDLCINSSRLGIDATGDAIGDYIDKRLENK